MHSTIVPVLNVRARDWGESDRLDSSGHRIEDFVDNSGQVVCLLPRWVMRLKLACVTDIPDVVADPVVFGVDQVHFLAGTTLTEADRLPHRAIAESAATRVVNLARPRRLVILPEHVDQVQRVDIVADLLALITEDGVSGPRQRALDQIRQETMQHGARVARAGQTATAEAGRVHAEVATILLNHGVGGKLRNAEQRVLGLINRQILVDPVLVVWMATFDLPARLELDQRQTVGVVAIHLVGGREDEAGLGARTCEWLPAGSRCHWR